MQDLQGLVRAGLAGMLAGAGRVTQHAGAGMKPRRAKEEVEIPLLALL